MNKIIKNFCCLSYFYGIGRAKKYLLNLDINLFLPGFFHLGQGYIQYALIKGGLNHVGFHPTGQLEYPLERSRVSLNAIITSTRLQNPFKILAHR